MLITFLTALIAGLIISMPVGPISILIIQKTISKGRWTGFYNGIGAALSDFIYSGIVIWGLHFIIDLIKAQESLIQIIGSLILLTLGVFMIRSKPVKKLKSSTINETNPFKEILSAFLLTFSNPLILFYFLGVFSYLNITASASTPQTLTIWIGFFIGVNLWFFTLTGLINALGKRFNIRKIGVLNIISGCAIIALSTYGIVSALIN